jgi:hypothetical protein
MGADDDRRAVKTYVPGHQKDAWSDHADRLDMSTSEFVRTMVQAGRRNFELPELERPEGTPDEESGEGSSSGRDSGGSDLEDRVVEALRSDGVMSWDQLLAAVTEDVEDRLESTLEGLQDDNRVRYSGRDGGYVLTDE